MKYLTKHFPLLTLLLLAGIVTQAQTLTVNTGSSATQLVQDVLIGSGVQVSNIEYTGNAAAVGSFDGSSSNIGLGSGVIIATGKAVDAVGPNNTVAGEITEEGTEFFGPGDAQLTAISSKLTFDAAILEFDFVPSADSVQFKYVFASNEYMNFVGAEWNDVFAFLISGPGISGEQNLALVPGSANAVTIDNVNADTNSQFYIDNGDNPGEQGGQSVSYNGFTKVLTARIVLMRCETYHIRLAIADGGDEKYDSAVFLEAGSFSTPSVFLDAQSSYSASANEEVLIEGCSTMSITFERSEPLDNPLTVNLVFSGTADNGIDFTNIPSIVQFAAGSATSVINFSVIEDGTVEPTESFTITLDLGGISCQPPEELTVEFEIEDAQDFSIDISDNITFFPCPQEYAIDVTPIGGYPDYTYLWSGTAETGSSITVFPLETTTYNVVVTDACSFTANASVEVNTSSYQPLQVSATNAIVCNGDIVTLESTVTGGLGNYIYLWDNGLGTESDYTFIPTQSNTITLQVTDECNIAEQTTSEITVNQIIASFTTELVRNDVIQFTNTTVDGYGFLWEFGDDSTGTAENPRHVYVVEGTYYVLLTVTNENGCQDTVGQEITVYPPLRVYIPNAFTPNGDSINDTWGVVGEGFLYYDMEIYDRWGKQLLSGRFTNANVWDGTLNGIPVPQGIYIYKVFVEPPIGIEIREAGVVSVLPGKR